MIQFFSKKSTRFIELVVDEGSDLSDKDIERAKRFFFLVTDATTVKGHDADDGLQLWPRIGFRFQESGRFMHAAKAFASYLWTSSSSRNN